MAKPHQRRETHRSEQPDDSVIIVVPPTSPMRDESSSSRYARCASSWNKSTRRD
jgi:hypothetical protein